MSASGEELEDDLFYENEDGEVPPRKKKRGPLFWILGGCGCGCLLIVIAALVGGTFFYRAFENGQLDEVKWPALDKALAFDEQPEELEVELYFDLFGYEQFHFSHEGLQLTAVLNVYATEKDARVLFDPDMPTLNPFAEDDIATVEIQGREVRYVLFGNKPDLSGMPEFMQDWVELPETETAGTTLRADLSDDRRGRILDLGRSGEESLTVADLEAFLEPFDVWNQD